jgi:hypothetical protein
LNRNHHTRPRTGSTRTLAQNHRNQNRNHRKPSLNPSKKIR